MPLEFAAENERIAKQHAISLGVAMGYCYQDSPIIINASSNYRPENWSDYFPIAEPGFFAPHCHLTENKSL